MKNVREKERKESEEYERKGRGREVGNVSEKERKKREGSEE